MSFLSIKAAYLICIYQINNWRIVKFLLIATLQEQYSCISLISSHELNVMVS